MPADPAAEPNANDELLVDIGDLVVFRFDDEPDKTKRVRISLSLQDPERGIVKVGDPLADCLMGCAVEDPFELKLSGGHVRTGIVEHIDRRSSLAE